MIFASEEKKNDFSRGGILPFYPYPLPRDKHKQKNIGLIFSL